MNLKRDVINGIRNLEIIHLQRNFSDMALPMWEFLIQRSSHNHIDDLIHIRLLAVINFSGQSSISENCSSVANTFNFLHSVGNINKGDSLSLQGFDNVEEVVDLMVGQRRCWLVQNNDGRILRKDLYDFHDLLVCHG